MHVSVIYSDSGDWETKPSKVKLVLIAVKCRESSKSINNINTDSLSDDASLSFVSFSHSYSLLAKDSRFQQRLSAFTFATVTYDPHVVS